MKSNCRIVVLLLQFPASEIRIGNGILSFLCGIASLRESISHCCMRNRGGNSGSVLELTDTHLQLVNWCRTPRSIILPPHRIKEID